MIFLFIHGGPGLNSNPERNLISASLCHEGHEVHFWDEPSVTRGGPNKTTSFQETCISLIELISTVSRAGKVTLIGHSFGAFLINKVLPDVESMIERVVLIAPVLSLPLLDFNLINIARNEYQTGIEAETLNSYLERFDHRLSFDEERFQILLTSVQNKSLASCYWHQKKKMISYMDYFSGCHSFDLNNFKSIRSSCSDTQWTNRSNIKVDVVLGVYDGFVKIEEIKNLRLFYMNATVHIFNNSAHFPHIEEPEAFNSILLKEENLRRLEVNHFIEVSKKIIFLNETV